MNKKGRIGMLIGGIILVVAALVVLILFMTGVLGGQKPNMVEDRDQSLTGNESSAESRSPAGTESESSGQTESVPTVEEILASLPKLPKKKTYVVGEDIVEEELTEFYYTRSGSTNPPYFQRFRFFVENGKHYMYHEKREGDTWPLTEEYITISGTVELTEEEWKTFWNYIKDGTVRSRSENIDEGDGGDGPWMFIYWLRDPSDFQEYSFDDYNKVLGFEDFCFGLMEEK